MLLGPRGVLWGIDSWSIARIRHFASIRSYSIPCLSVIGLSVVTENEVDAFEDMALFQESIVSIERFESLSIMLIFQMAR